MHDIIFCCQKSNLMHTVYNVCILPEHLKKQPPTRLGRKGARRSQKKMTSLAEHWNSWENLIKTPKIIQNLIKTPKIILISPSPIDAGKSFS